MSTDNKNTETKQCTIPSVSSSACGLKPNMPIYDELEDLRRNYTPEQIRKMWNDATPKKSNIKGMPIILGTSEQHYC